PADPVVKGGQIRCCSASDLPPDWTETFDLVVTDPPFGDNIFYGDLANFFHVWLRPLLVSENPDVFRFQFSPRAQECVADRSRFPANERDDDEQVDQTPANAFYERCLRECWAEAWRVTKAGGLLAFTFHHSADAPWVTVLHSLFDAGWILEAAFPI